MMMVNNEPRMNFKVNAATDLRNSYMPPVPVNNSVTTTQGLICFSCGEKNHGLRGCPKFNAECRADPERRRRCAGCHNAGLCTKECSRRLFFASLPGEFVELCRHGRSHFCRKDRLPDWYRADLYVGKLIDPNVNPPQAKKGGAEETVTQRIQRCNMVTTVTAPEKEAYLFMD